MTPNQRACLYLTHAAVTTTHGLFLVLCSTNSCVAPLATYFVLLPDGREPDVFSCCPQDSSLQPHGQRRGRHKSGIMRRLRAMRIYVSAPRYHKARLQSSTRQHTLSYSTDTTELCFLLSCFNHSADTLSPGRCWTLCSRKDRTGLSLRGTIQALATTR